VPRRTAVHHVEVAVAPEVGIERHPEQAGFAFDGRDPTREIQEGLDLGVRDLRTVLEPQHAPGPVEHVQAIDGARVRTRRQRLGGEEDERGAPQPEVRERLADHHRTDLGHQREVVAREGRQILEAAHLGQGRSRQRHQDKGQDDSAQASSGGRGGS